MNKSKLLLLMATGLMVACNSHNFKSYEDYPVYEGDEQEMTYSEQSTSFRIWSPEATQAKLFLYEDGLDGSAYQIVEMSESNDGTFIAKVDGDLKGKFYTFQVRVKEVWQKETPGVWAKAVGVNGNRACIIDMHETNPEGWERDVKPALQNFTDIVLYEVHMRDFSVAPNSGIKNKGKFLAFTEKGSVNSLGLSTGIDHLKDLGITHVHLLPSFDYASVDESKLADNKYNWGYDPKNYNVPEGSYSSDPYNPYARIREFKEMVLALHKAGIRVIMDVVYNHTSANEDSHLNTLVPGYYYRFKENGEWSDASGCGNELASERPMVRKFMIESILYWAKEYHVDGFRFDLMGIHDIETMNQIRAALDRVDPTIFMYGEGWTAGASVLPEDQRALKKNARQFDGIAVFSDDIRDALKGSWMHSEIPGFVSGIDSLEESVKFGIVASCEHPQVDYSKAIYSKEAYVNNPTEIINYVSCHDDLCLVDKLKESRPTDATDAEIVRFDLLAQSVVFTSQGVPFIYAGEELMRTKKGVHNTYQSPDSINQINWDLKSSHKDVYDYYKGLISLRKQHPAFRIPDADLVRKHLRFLPVTQPNVVGFVLNGHVNGDAWKNIMVIYNGNREAVETTIPKNKWNIVCYDGKIDLHGLGFVNDTSFILPPSSASVLYAN